MLKKRVSFILFTTLHDVFACVAINQQLWQNIWTLTQGVHFIWSTHWKTNPNALELVKYEIKIDAMAYTVYVPLN